MAHICLDGVTGLHRKLQKKHAIYEQYWNSLPDRKWPPEEKAVRS